MSTSTYAWQQTVSWSSMDDAPILAVLDRMADEHLTGMYDAGAVVVDTTRDDQPSWFVADGEVETAWGEPMARLAFLGNAEGPMPRPDAVALMWRRHVTAAE